MKKTGLLRRFAALALCAQLSFSAAAADPVLTVRDGRVAVRDGRNGGWLYVSEIPEDMLPARDRLLLQTGLELPTRADYTSAIEDFCS